MNFYSITSKLYDLLDATYFANKKKSPRTVINDLIPDEKICILDMCCGTMANSIPIARSHKNVCLTGIDISEKMLQVADKKIAKYELDTIKTKCTDATNTQLPEESADYIIIGLALHEMSPELRKKLLAESHRLLKKTGQLIVMEWEEQESLWKRILYGPMYLLEKMLCKTFREFYYCDKKEYFQQNGFALIEAYHCNYSVVMAMKKE